jgi:MFS family permease
MGVHADRSDEAHFPVVAAMLTAGGIGYLLVAVASLGHVRWLFAAAAIVAAGAGWGWNARFNLAVVRAHLHAPATATGFTDVGGRLGGVLGPVVAGQVLDHAPYAVAWLVMMVAAFGAATAVLIGRQQLARASEPGSR